MNKEGQGFLTFARNSDDVDYLKLAYLQCLNVKATQKENKYAVVVNQATRDKMTDNMLKAFDHVVCFESESPFQAEAYALALTPFKETIKLESDLLFTRNIDHWWTSFRLKNMCLPTAAKTFMGINGTVRKYRELFDANNLPNVYNGLMYFRYSKEAHDFFQMVAYIQREWAHVKVGLKKCLEEQPSTDVMFGLAAIMLGEETCTMPSMDFLNFVHMKSEFNGWSDNRSWVDTVMNERDGDIIRINNLNQYNPVHYYDKTYATDELIGYYEQRVLGRV